MTNKNDMIEIDLLRLMQAMWHRIWVILLSMVVFAAMALGYTAFLVTPRYQADALMYVNSSNISLGGTKVNISQGELNAAQSLIDTYGVILKARTTLNDVIASAGLTCTYEELLAMITTESVNETEVFRITVTNSNPEQAALIANTIAQLLPEKIASIVEGSSARIVDMAVIPSRPASPSYPKNLLIGAILGLLVSCGIVAVRELMDDKIYGSDYLAQNYDLPILAAIPDLLSSQDSATYYYGGPAKKAPPKERR